MHLSRAAKKKVVAGRTVDRLARDRKAEVMCEHLCTRDVRISTKIFMLVQQHRHAGISTGVLVPCIN
ncbi:hypothetical protein CBOM_07794 [Ceraceosorus bombacis]|uniref:Uncharacterized protein n=1 Tax=Ceraceosorus bombacis TaxID=401625 RepID=A0A0P1BNV1_9BASI|nr:hypothetical protein CBOM_07794 [Ceraceosorus bombacis]